MKNVKYEPNRKPDGTMVNLGEICDDSNSYSEAKNNAQFVQAHVRKIFGQTFSKYADVVAAYQPFSIFLFHFFFCYFLFPALFRIGAFSFHIFFRLCECVRVNNNNNET